MLPQAGTGCAGNDVPMPGAALKPRLQRPARPGAAQDEEQRVGGTLLR